MDEYYDFKEAKEALHKYTTERNKDNSRSRYQMCQWENGIASKCRPLTTPDNRITKCVVTNPLTSEYEEAVLYMQGIIVDVDLPPVKFRPRPQQVRHIRQSVTLCGLGQKAFGEAMSNLYGLHTLLSRRVPPGSLERWQPAEHQGFLAAELQNRYFTLRKFSGGMAKYPFDSFSDPRGYLEDCTTHELYHTEENHVDYFTVAAAGSDAADPASFRVGDIVEASFSVIMAPIGPEKYKMLLVLRSVAHVDSSHTMNADTKRSHSEHSTIPRSGAGVIKRRRGYSPPATPTASPGTESGADMAGLAKKRKGTDDRNAESQNVGEAPMET
ncbi:hypothetical protein BJ138DRAFT_1221961 [Hygrophoropsis aurantiaca]|uniref:Uncharacterized protein n=1 Tax=Hygrophoropsis aurantiaca TaxID=72124 RepID=A0ACB7ZZC8_9AGAM|nr:hypothetical protein BJ138DRAFT_1221961 [Hygrophoropsis aurantiaca]